MLGVMQSPGCVKPLPQCVHCGRPRVMQTKESLFWPYVHLFHRHTSSKGPDGLLNAVLKLASRHTGVLFFTICLTIDRVA